MGLTPFEVTAGLAGLCHPYPDSESLKAALLEDSEKGYKAVAHLWLSEGVPFVFQGCPAAFEVVREWLSGQLCIHPKDITLIGSARIGYSLASRKFGEPFGEKSDLDFSIVSVALFEKLVKDFKCFEKDYESGVIQPKNNRERYYWPKNIVFGSENIPKGFLDSNKIPNHDNYPSTQNVNDLMWQLHTKLKFLDNVPQTRKVSARIYRDWNSFTQQLVKNIKYTIRKFESL